MVRGGLQVRLGRVAHVSDDFDEEIPWHFDQWIGGTLDPPLARVAGFASHVSTPLP